MKKLSQRIDEAKLDEAKDHVKVHQLVDDADAPLQGSHKINWPGGGYAVILLETGGREFSLTVHLVKDLDNAPKEVAEMIDDFGPADESDMSSENIVQMFVQPDFAEIVKLPNKKLTEVDFDFEESSVTIS